MQKNMCLKKAADPRLLLGIKQWEVWKTATNVQADAHILIR
jgi:hypothetical protein